MGALINREPAGEVEEAAIEAVWQKSAEAAQALTVLSPREQEVVELIADGHTSKSAARVIGISPRTVDVHRANAMHKLGAAHTAPVIRLVVLASLLPLQAG